MGRLRLVPRAGWIVVFSVGLVVVLAGLLLTAQQRAPAASPDPSAQGSSALPSASGGAPSSGTTAAASPMPSPSAGGAVASPGLMTPHPPSSLAALLATLPVRPEHRAGYERSLFRHWIDADRDGCDTRREVLISEAIASPSVGPSCTLIGGSWGSAYDGLTFTDPAGLDVDHMVPLAEAWDSGAFAWSPDRRMRYANDLGVPWALVAVSAASNRSKGDQDPADWLPTLDSFGCTYIAWWIEVKARWSLSVDAVERETLVGVVAGCPGVSSEFVPAGE